MASTLPTFRSELKTAVEANGVISAADVKVYKYLIPNAEGDAYIEFTRATLDESYQAQNTKKEMYDLRVNILSRIPGKGDTKAATAEANVLAWADAIKAEIKTDKTMNSSVTECRWVGGQVDNQLNDKGRWCLYEGHIEVRAFNV